jgi:predicted ATPase/class 3 adenylate cyclase
VKTFDDARLHVRGCGRSKLRFLAMRICPRCGEENPDRARFCLQCGEHLADPGPGRSERKFATALFADLVGSTSLTEREDPEVVQFVVSRAFDRLAEEVHRYEGLLEKFVGDALLAVFGVPRAHEDDAERAVRAALGMQAVLSELNRAFAAEGKPSLEMRIGVESGEVIVDQDRAAGPRDRMLTGDAVNVASRLQSAAEPGRVVVGPGAFASTKESVEYREIPALQLKGRAERVPAWEALRIRARQRGERPQLGMQAKLVGRGEELAVLKETFRRVQGEGRVALVTVVGPAGVGKTRLVRELEGYVDELPEFVYWRRGRCLAYGSSSYSALADAVKAQCEILEDDASDVALKKVENAVRELFGDTDVAPQIAALVGAGEPGSFNREDLFEAWRRFLERMAARYPLALVLEDIQWANNGLLDFVEYMADWAQGPILLAALARPELLDSRSTWGGGKRNATTIYLEPLSPEESATMVDDLLAGGLTPALTDTIATRSEGNPLYVEEIVRKLIDDGNLRGGEGSPWKLAKPIDDVELPRSIQSLIAARLDALPDDEKSLLQDASVVGRVFWSGAVASVSGLPVPEIHDALGRLRVKELIQPNEPPSFSGEQEFTFRHALLRDGAYDSLPKSLRARKHRQVAAWAQERAGDRAEEIAELIATHLLEALRYLNELGDVSDERRVIQREAYRWARAAGSRSSALWLAADAIDWYGEALRLAEMSGVSVSERAQLAVELLDVSWGVGPSDAFERACRAAIELCEAAADERGAGAAESSLMTVLFLQGRDEEALDAGARSLERLEKVGESAELADALRALGQFHWRHGNSAEADAYLRRAIDVAGRVDAPASRAAAMQDLAIELGQTGHTDEAMQTIEGAFSAAKQVGDRVNLQRAYNNYASLLAHYGSDLRHAREIALEGLQRAEKGRGAGWMGWLRNTAAEISFNLGELDEAEQGVRLAIQHATAAGDRPLTGLSWGNLSWVLLWRGRLDEAQEALFRAREILREKREPQGEIVLERVDGELAVAQGRNDDALDRFRRGTALAAEYSVDQEPRVILELIRLLLRRGDREEAGQARAILRRGRSPFASACLRNADGLFAVKPHDAVADLENAVEQFDELEARVDVGRALLDLGRALRAAGRDPSDAFERSRSIFVACDAQLFVSEVEAEITHGA